MELEKWLEQKNISIKTFADKVNLSRQIIHGYLNGKLPTIPTAMRIEEATDGQVELYSWTEGTDSNPKRGKNRKETDPKKTVDTLEDLW